MSKYSYCSSLQPGCPIYNDIKRTSLYTNGYISNGSQYWTTNASGILQAPLACPVYYPKLVYIGIKPPFLNPMIGATKNGTYFNEFNNIYSADGWSKTALSYDGSIIGIIRNAGSGGNVNTAIFYLSVNGGQSFSARTIPQMYGTTEWYQQSFVDIAMSYSGQYIIILTNYAHTENTNWPRTKVMVSQNYGATWTEAYEEVNNEGYFGTPKGVAISGNGAHMMVLYANGKIKKNSQYGYSGGWSLEAYPGFNSNNPGVVNFSNGAISYDGRYRWATADANDNGKFATMSSADYGSGYLTLNNLGTSYGYNYTSMSVSATGQYVSYTSAAGDFWLSNDYGSGSSSVNLASLGRTGILADLNFDGSYMACIGSDGLIYTSSNYGSTWNNIDEFVGSSIDLVVASGSLAPSVPSYPIYGTFLYNECNGCDLYAVRADGLGGWYYAEIVQYNTEVCCFSGGGGGGGGGGGIEEIQ